MDETSASGDLPQEPRRIEKTLELDQNEQTKALVINIVRPLLKGHESSLSSGLDNFGEVKASYLSKLFHTRAHAMGLSIEQYQAILKGNGAKGLCRQEVDYFLKLITLEAVGGIRPVPLEGFLDRSPAGDALGNIFKRRIDGNARPLYFRFFGLGDGGETRNMVTLTDRVLDDILDRRPNSVSTNKDAEKRELAEALGLNFEFYDINSGVLANGEDVVNDLEKKYPWFQNRAGINFCNVFDPTLFSTWEPNSTAAIFARNMFNSSPIYPQGKDFLDNAMNTLTHDGLIMTDLSSLYKIQLGQREYAPLQSLKPIYQEDRYGNDIQGAAVLLRFERSKAG